MAVLPLLAGLETGVEDEAGARSLVEWLALALQASVLLRAGSPMATAFCRSRLGAAHGLAFGTLPTELDFGAIIARALPA
jgi:putative acyl-CoA dehydrogenase